MTDDTDRSVWRSMQHLLYVAFSSTVQTVPGHFHHKIRNQLFTVAYSEKAVHLKIIFAQWFKCKEEYSIVMTVNVRLLEANDTELLSTRYSIMRDLKST